MLIVVSISFRQDNKQLVTNMVNALFLPIGYQQFTNGGALDQFRFVMFASLLMYLPAMETELGYEDVIVRKMMSVAFDHEVRLSVLHVWGDKVMEQFKIQNVMNRAAKQDDIDRANIAIELLTKDNIKLKKQSDILESKVDSMAEKLENVLDVVLSIKNDDGMW